MTKDERHYVPSFPMVPLSRRSFLQRSSAIAISMAGLPTALAACSGPQPAEDGGGDLSSVDWGQSFGPPDMNPLRRFDVQGSMVLALGLEGLLAFDRDFRLVPNLAADFGSSSDLTVWTFRVKDGITFSDGSPMTMEDVLFSYQEHVTNPQSAFGFFYGVVSDIRAKGTTDLVVELNRPDVVFPYTAAHTAGFVWQKESAQRMGDRFGTPGNLPIGTGPYRFVEYVQGDHVTLELNENYRGDAPAAEELAVRTIPEDSSRMLSLQTGQINGTFDVPPEQLNQWEELESAAVSQAPGLGVAYLSFNVTRPPFDDIHVRKAFAYALDREGLVSTAIQGAGEVATAFVPPPFWNPLGLDRQAVLDQYGSFPQYEFNMDRAREELALSSHSGDLTVQVDYPNSYQRLGKMLLNLKQNLAGIGVTLNVGSISEDQWFADLYENREEIALLVGFYRPDFPDPANYASFFHSNQIEGGNNYGMYSNQEVDGLLNEQSRLAEPEARVEPLMRVLEIIAEDVAVAPAWWESSLLATTSGITAYPDPVWYLNPWATTIEPA